MRKELPLAMALIGAGAAYADTFTYRFDPSTTITINTDSQTCTTDMVFSQKGNVKTIVQGDSTLIILPNKQTIKITGDTVQKSDGTPVTEAQRSNGNLMAQAAKTACEYTKQYLERNNY